MSRLTSLTLLLALACTPTSESNEPQTTTTAAQPGSTTEQPSNTEQPNEQPSNTEQPSTPAEQPSNTEQPTVDEEQEDGPSVTLTHVDKKVTVEVGTLLRYSFKSHASVGYGAKYEIGDPAVLEHLRTDMDYMQSEAERAEKDGADAATATYVFKAKAPGKSKLEVREMFRGKVEHQIEYTITVK